MKKNDPINKFKKRKINNIISEDPFHFSDNSQDKNKPTERSFYQDEKKVYIITVDINGNFNLYHNNKNKTIFNLYNISNIDNKYKEEEFFALGFPYYVTMNSTYFAITTDHGVFVLSNKV